MTWLLKGVSGDSRFEMQETDLKDGPFRSKVYRDILAPLEENLRMFPKCDIKED